MSLLSDIDGVKDNNNIFIIGTTNDVSQLDPAIIRPGRFDSIHSVPLPSEEDKCTYIDKLTSEKYKEKFNDLDTEEFKRLISENANSCADIKNILNKASSLAFSNQNKADYKVKIEDINQVLELEEIRNKVLQKQKGGMDYII